MRTRIALTLALVGGFTLLPGPSAQAAPEAWVEATGTLRVVTQGYGHGIGLSQWGAQGRAVKGQKVDEILGFYYPGTTQGTAGGSIKVLITGDTDKNLIVRPVKGLKVKDFGTGKSYTLPTSVGATAWKLKTVAGKTRLSYLRKGVYKDYKPKGKTFRGVGEFRAAGKALNLRYAGKDHFLRGGLRFVDGKTVNTLSLEAYLRGVVPAEVFTSWKPEALKAQAVAARTYAAFERADYASRSFHVYDTTRSQVYRGAAIEHPATDAAIAATAGRVVLYRGALAFTQFSASNGGLTANGSRPYLDGGREDTFDTEYLNRDFFIGPVTKPKIQKAFPALGTLQRVRVLSRFSDNRVDEVELDGSKAGTVVTTGAKLRSVTGMRSTYFSFVS